MAEKDKTLPLGETAQGVGTLGVVRPPKTGLGVLSRLNKEPPPKPPPPPPEEVRHREVKGLLSGLRDDMKRQSEGQERQAEAQKVIVEAQKQEVELNTQNFDKVVGKLDETLSTLRSSMERAELGEQVKETLSEAGFDRIVQAVREKPTPAFDVSELSGLLREISGKFKEPPPPTTIDLTPVLAKLDGVISASRDRVLARATPKVSVDGGDTVTRKTRVSPLTVTEDAVEYFASRLDEAPMGITYVGQAVPGTADSAALWQIKRLETSGNDITTTWAGGNANFDKVWDDRASLSYS